LAIRNLFVHNKKIHLDLVLYKKILNLKPNDDTATRARLDSYIVTINDIERESGMIFTQFTASEKAKKPARSWIKPSGCTAPPPDPSDS
jgi:hypothetical protein